MLPVNKIITRHYKRNVSSSIMFYNISLLFNKRAECEIGVIFHVLSKYILFSCHTVRARTLLYVVKTTLGTLNI